MMVHTSVGGTELASAKQKSTASPLTRSISVPGGEEETNHFEGSEKGDSLKSNVKVNSGSKVAVSRFDDDETFSKFFQSVQKTVIQEGVEIADFDAIKSTEK